MEVISWDTCPFPRESPEGYAWISEQIDEWFESCYQALHVRQVIASQRRRRHR